MLESEYFVVVWVSPDTLLEYKWRAMMLFAESLDY